jgi:hypothetical protein
MGYSTEFKGELKFTRELTATQLAKLMSFFGKDCRDHPEWMGGSDLTYVDLEFLGDFSGIRWNGAKKTYDMVAIVNMVTLNMQKEWPDFGLSGKMLAQGQEIDDRWELIINDKGFAEREDVALAGKEITCPHCEGKFIYEG